MCSAENDVPGENLEYSSRDREVTLLSDCQGMQCMFTIVVNTTAFSAGEHAVATIQPGTAPGMSASMPLSRGPQVHVQHEELLQHALRMHWYQNRQHSTQQQPKL